MEVKLSSTEETKKLAESLAPRLKAGNVVALYGDLGSGKTTFTRYLVEALGVKAHVQSPTFVVARKYSGGGHRPKSVNHIDLYRLTCVEEVLEMGLSEFFCERDALTVIEWPELAESILPKSTIRLHFTFVDENTRLVSGDVSFYV